MEQSLQRGPDSPADHPARPSIEELAAQQGVTPITNTAELLGTPSPEDESVEEFAAMLRAWRREGAETDRCQ